ncbi:MAG TPA: hypothetical protein DEF18_02725 [Muricauda sp.]|uniref:Long-chain fatty acid transport protein n=1 Tax=Flagellimonas aurea TaxID=2915619 RepID=A0ABS3G8C9_9FLAO|nr:hypothetical protein [Allomuricauda aurea]MAO18386.1 hypothetical protein [Allomuricauda sp.]MBO0355322.1 hypothetical protein [Allomuricauda aurea]UBZ15331.1 hypothetical protein LDL77_06355 [Allomuricauda aquimarina]HBU76992.1 hypothetical protein [Allomuricauda sp.]
MIKKILIAFLCVVAHGAFAQNGTISPYSYFGIGDDRDKGAVDTQMMGGVSMYGDSIHINLSNPAAYSKLRLTAYTAGISHKEYQLKSWNEEQRTSVTNLDYLAIGFPLAKNVGFGFGIMPYSSVGYSLNSTSNSANGEVSNFFEGEGGLNRLYASIGFEPIKNLSFGVTANFNFGTLEYQRIQSVEGVQFGTLDDRESNINGYDFKYALNYNPTIKDKYTLYTSVLINTQGNLTSENTQTLGSFSLVTGNNVEVVDVDLDASNLRNTELKIPTRTTFGLGFGENKKWFLGAEYSFQQMGDFENTFLGLDNIDYGDANTYALGGYWIPDYRSLTGYFNRITYRAGLRYDMTGMTINNKEINNFGITFGLGLPLGGDFSNINVGFELGRRGTTDANLIEESYFKINLGLSLNARWFVKTKIN